MINSADNLLFTYIIDDSLIHLPRFVYILHSLLKNVMSVVVNEC